VGTVELEEEKPGRSHRIKIMRGWIFALVMGLLVSVTDFKLPAETAGIKSEPVASPLSRTLVKSADSWTTALDRSGAVDLSAIVFNPPEELEFQPMDQIIHEAAGRYDVDFDLIRAVIMVESGFNPQAKSKKGARGLMQLMPVTANELDVADLLDPEENIDAGVRYLRILLDRFDGDVELALAAYNAGYSNVLRHDGVPPYKETRLFIARVLDYYTTLRDDVGK
jgi:soluble lytic murein transglycosylase-like protein